MIAYFNIPMSRFSRILFSPIVQQTRVRDCTRLNRLISWQYTCDILSVSPSIHHVRFTMYSLKPFPFFVSTSSRLRHFITLWVQNWELPAQKEQYSVFSSNNSQKWPMDVLEKQFYDYLAVEQVHQWLHCCFIWSLSKLIISEVTQMRNTELYLLWNKNH